MRTLSALLTVAAVLGSMGLAQAGTVVTLKADGVAVINGEPVFPIGFTLGPPPEGKTPEGKDGLQELAGAGATFLRTGPTGGGWDEAALAREQEWEDAAAEHGLLCWVFLRELGSVGPDQPEREGATVEVEFSGLPEDCGRGEVLYEEPRTLQATKGSFTDWFGPFEVHVYRFARPAPATAAP